MKSIKKNKQEKIRMSQRTGLIFPVGRIGGMLRKGHYAPQVSVNAAIQMTSILEYLVKELLEISVDVTQKGMLKTITPRHIQDAMNMDEDLNVLASQLNILAGGQAKNKRGRVVGGEMPTQAQQPTQKAMKVKK